MIIKRYIISLLVLFFFLCINPVGCVYNQSQILLVHLHRFVVKLGLQLLGISHFPDSFHEIFLNYEVMISTDCKHPWGGRFNSVNRQHELSLKFK